jgi:hypothetical protein
MSSRQAIYVDALAKKKYTWMRETGNLALETETMRVLETRLRLTTFFFVSCRFVIYAPDNFIAQNCKIGSYCTVVRVLVCARDCLITVSFTSFVLKKMYLVYLNLDEFRL